MSANADQVAYWNETAGPKWVTNQARLDALMAPLTEALVTVAAPRPGEAVLDIGCGCGDLALRMAQAVGSDGRVVGIDVSEPMLAHARSRAGQLAGPHAPLELRKADASTEPFEPAFDLLTSRFGTMFFAEPRQAFENLRRAAKHGGRLAMLTWRRRVDVEWMHLPLEWIAPVIAPPEMTDGQPGPFGLADGPATSDMLNAAGFHDVEPVPIDRTLTLGRDIEEALVTLCDTGPAAGAMREAEPDLASRAQDLIRRGLAQHVTSDGVQLRAGCWLYRAHA